MTAVTWACRQVRYQLQQAKEDEPAELLSREEMDTHHPIMDTEVSFITKLRELKMLLGPKVKHCIFLKAEKQGSSSNSATKVN